MSGNSRCRRRQTAPIVRSFSREGAATVIPGPTRLPGHLRRNAERTLCVSLGAVGRSSAACQEGHPVLPDLDLVAILELRALDAASVDERAVQRALVLDREAAVVLGEHRVPARDGDVVEEDAAVRR